MANNLTINVSETFFLYDFAERLAEMYRAKGFTVNIANVDNTTTLTFDKDTGGLNTITGLGVGIKATCIHNGNTLTINYSDPEIMSKVIAGVAGWFLCWIPLVTCAIGAINQISLPGKINTDATTIAAGM